MKSFMRKNWFVCVVAVLFLVIAVYFIYDQNKDVLWGKSANGSGVVFSLDGTNYTAEDMYNKYYLASGEDVSYMLMQRVLLDNAVKTTEELKSEASELALQYKAYFTQIYGTSADAMIAQNLTSIGLKTLDEYCLYNLKLETLDKQYVLANLDDVWGPFASEYQPKIVYHCLITMADPENPTEAELAALDEAKKAWASGEYTFEEFAKKYSDDSSSAVNGGRIGYLDKDSSDTYVAEFVAGAEGLKTGEVSDWIKSQYGYHLITVTSEKPEDCITETSCIERLLTYWPNLEKQAMWAEMNKQGTVFADSETEKSVKEALGVKEDGTIDNGKTEEAQ